MSKEYRFTVVRTMIQKAEIWGTGDTVEEARDDAESALNQNDRVDCLNTPGYGSQWDDVEEDTMLVPVEVREIP